MPHYRLTPSRVWSAALIVLGLGPSAGCRSDGVEVEAGGSETSGETETETGDAAVAPMLLAEPELVFHPNQPMVVDVVVELDRPATVSLVHDEDAGVRVASLAIEDEGRRHHLRMRGLAPARAHALTLTLADLEDPSASATQPLSFMTDFQQSGFRWTYEVEVHDAAALDPAYRLFDYTSTPLWDPAGIFVVDPHGQTRWYYNSGLPELPGPTAIWAGVQLLADGSILAVRDGVVTIIDELGEQPRRHAAADYELAPFHHDVYMLDNGNILTLSNSFEVVDYSSLGLSPDTLVAGDLLVEIDPTGEIVWTWDTFDHLDPLRIRSDPGEGLSYIDPVSGEPGYDWTHGNGVVHTADDDVVLLSLRHQDWILAIDHASGEILWRLGEEGDFALQDGAWFFHQHSPEWQPDGSLLLYDNAIGNPDVPDNEAVSRAVRYALDLDAMTATQVWDSVEGEAVVSAVAGDADRTPTGNVMVLDSSLQPDPAEFDIGQNYSRLIERSSGDPASAIWSLTTNQGSFVYRATEIDRLPGEVAGG